LGQRFEYFGSCQPLLENSALRSLLPGGRSDLRCGAYSNKDTGAQRRIRSRAAAGMAAFPIRRPSRANSSSHRGDGVLRGTLCFERSNKESPVVLIVVCVVDPRLKWRALSLRAEALTALAEPLIWERCGAPLGNAGAR